MLQFAREVRIFYEEQTLKRSIIGNILLKTIYSKTNYFQFNIEIIPISIIYSIFVVYIHSLILITRSNTIKLLIAHFKAISNFTTH